MWDAIMQVGKTPQITADANLNPYQINQDDISQLFFIYLSDAGSGCTVTGTVLNLTNQLYDYSISPAVVVTQSGAGGTDTVIIADCGKVLNVRGISLYFQHDHQGPDQDAILYLDGTEDGSTWTTLSSYSFADVAALTDITLNASDVRLKALRIRIDYIGGGGGSFIININKLRIWVDSKQYFYA